MMNVLKKLSILFIYFSKCTFAGALFSKCTACMEHATSWKYLFT